MPDTDLEAPQIVEQDIEDSDGARVLAPVQFFDPGASLTDRDFRPKVLKTEGTAPIVMDPSEAHDPHVSPFPDKEFAGSADMPELPGENEPAPAGEKGPFD